MKWKFPYYDIDNGVDWSRLGSECSWFQDMEFVDQDPIWHAEGNVQIHTKMVVNSLISHDEFIILPEQDKHILVVSALMHDIEKRNTTTEDSDGKIIAPHHSQYGERTARRILYTEYDTPFTIREEICSLVRFHGAPLWSINEDTIHKKIIQISQRCNIKHLSLLATADVLGRVCDDSATLLEQIEYFKELAKENKCYHSPKQFRSKLERYITLNDNTYNPNTNYQPYDESSFQVHMMVGIAGSGKDTYIDNNLNHLPMISLDGIRREFGVSPKDKKGNGRVIQEAKERCKILMRQRLDFVFNATNITVSLRDNWIHEFHVYNGKITIHYIETAFNKLIIQNKSREYIVPERVINHMIHILHIPQYNEVYDVIYDINEK